MSARVIPDGAGITNHFQASFAPWVSEAGFISISGLKDEVGMTDGPDGRGYMTGKPSRQTLTCVIPSHDPAAIQLATWKQACENGKPGHKVTGTVTVADVADSPISIYELQDCQCFSFEANDLSLDGGDVATESYMVSYSRLKRIGP